MATSIPAGPLSTLRARLAAGWRQDFALQFSQRDDDRPGIRVDFDALGGVGGIVERVLKDIRDDPTTTQLAVKTRLNAIMTELGIVP